MVVVECTEFLINLHRITQMAKGRDAGILISMTIATVANVLVTAPLIWYRKTSGAIIAEAAFDITFIAINAVDFTSADGKFDFLDWLSVFIPTACVTDLLSRLATEIAASTVEIGNTSRTNIGLFRIKFAAFEGETNATGKSVRERIQRTALIVLYLVSIGLLLLVTMSLGIRAVNCQKRYGDAVWNRVQPRIYMANGLFASASCGEGKVYDLDLSALDNGFPLPDMRAFTELTHLKLDANYLHDFPSVFSTMHPLKMLSVSLNPSLQINVSHFKHLGPNLQQLRFAGTKTMGNISDALLSMRSTIMHVDAESCNVSGNITVELIRSLPQLTYLNLRFSPVECANVTRDGILAEFGKLKLLL